MQSFLKFCSVVFSPVVFLILGFLVLASLPTICGGDISGGAGLGALVRKYNASPNDADRGEIEAHLRKYQYRVFHTELAKLKVDSSTIPFFIEAIKHKDPDVRFKAILAVSRWASYHPELLKWATDLLHVSEEENDYTDHLLSNDYLLRFAEGAVLDQAIRAHERLSGGFSEFTPSEVRRIEDHIQKDPETFPKSRKRISELKRKRFVRQVKEWGERAVGPLGIVLFFIVLLGWDSFQSRIQVTDVKGNSAT